jgi:uncharacterized protein YneF (UPF0154 family)
LHPIVTILVEVFLVAFFVLGYFLFRRRRAGRRDEPE